MHKVRSKKNESAASLIKRVRISSLREELKAKGD
jgi:hypothetical protein